MVRIRNRLIAPFLAPMIIGSLAIQAQETGVVAPREIRLRVEGDVPRPLQLSADDLAKLPHKKVRARDADGKETEFEGVSLFELLKAAEIQLEYDLRGPALASYLLVEAADGYRAVFALPELDPGNTDRVIILADRREGKPLDPKEGPLRIVVPGEKRHYRWVRQVVSIKLKKS
ncbi:MAG: molybdopterin-dependent oxidoreductase [Isosphaeraceae bacterium]